MNEFSDEEFLDFEKEEDEFINASREDESSEIVYPHAEIKVERDQYPIFQLYRKFNKGLIVLDPDFQREDVWKSKQKSELIESVLMGIPLPVFYLNESKEGKLIVVDGRQRLTTFFSYLNNEFRLQNLRILKDLNYCKFDDLEPKFQADLEDFQIIAQVIKPPTPDRIKFDIFDRVNRGGTALNNQEMRNALYQGKATQLLKNIAESEEFKEATQNSINSYRMKDKYLILRAIAFNSWNKDILLDANNKKIQYKNDIDEFLGKTMEYLNRRTDEFIKETEFAFLKSMKNNYIVMGDNAFRRIQANGRRQPINMILFEAMTILMWDWSQEYCYENKKVIESKIYDLLENEELNKLLTIDRGRGLVVPTILNMLKNLKEKIDYDI
ncbi:DUF262 domain-containing protein [Bacillus thuringiensis]|uniref:DUF262 domain-containing protein n=1 Tax=Bacillus thuringiensis TaxID=1428 RepID=A0AAW4HYQ0_BACTU|nr:DUF262 domain-containing protein [Bacillus thuringiensis]MBN9901367.1 DUF262 domain-containing protein [Bacillus thuringiensis]MDY7521678.1 DUF262 domain-containing protein [Bacillus thuringiensis]